MKTIRIMLMLLGLYVSNMAYGVKLPEFHGLYAVDGGKLIEIREGESYDLSPTVEFISYHSGLKGLEKAVFERNVYGYGVNGIRQQNTWTATGDEIEMRTKPVPGTTMTFGQPDMYYKIPRSPLTTGAYIILGTSVKFFINKKEPLLRQQECVDRYYLPSVGGGSKYIPCATSTPEQQGTGGANTSQTSGSNATRKRMEEAGKKIEKAQQSGDQAAMEQAIKEMASLQGTVESKQEALRAEVPGSGSNATPGTTTAVEEKAVGFKNNGNGTVTDNDKKLMWQQAGSEMMEWEPAVNYCKALSLAGYNDWRLPNRKELESILQQNKTYFLTTSCPSCPGYWTSTTDAKDTSWVWKVKLDRGDASSSKKTFKGYARCVRGGADVNAKDNIGTSP